MASLLMLKKVIIENYTYSNIQSNFNYKMMHGSLKTLQVTNSQISNHFFTFLKNIPSFESLRFYSCNLQKDIKIQAMPFKSSLKNLIIENCQIPTHFLIALSQSSKLEKLHISNCTFDFDDSSYISLKQFFPNLKEMFLSNSQNISFLLINSESCKELKTIEIHSDTRTPEIVEISIRLWKIKLTNQNLRIKLKVQKNIIFY